MLHCGFTCQRARKGIIAQQRCSVISLRNDSLFSICTNVGSHFSEPFEESFYLLWTSENLLISWPCTILDFCCSGHGHACVYVGQIIN